MKQEMLTALQYRYNKLKKEATMEANGVFGSDNHILQENGSVRLSALEKRMAHLEKQIKKLKRK